MAKHTSGPWRVKEYEDDFPGIIAEHGKAWDNPIICDLYEDVTPEDSVTFGRWLKAYPNANANARLIAAAPELLAACQALMRAEAMQTEGKRDGATMGQISLAIDAARAAITKAQGEG